MGEPTIALVECRRYHTKLTRVACDRYREQNPERCKGCTGSGEVVAEVPVERIDPMSQDPQRKSKHRVAACAECKRVLPLSGRGLCGRCYQRVLKAEVASSGPKRARKPVAAEAAVPLVHRDPPCEMSPTPSADALLIHFVGEDQALLRTLREVAKKARRSVEDQILYILEEVCRDSAG